MDPQPQLFNRPAAPDPPRRSRPGSRNGGRLARLRARLRRVTASTTAGGVMLVGLPLALDYVVRPGDTLSEIAARHGTSVQRIVKRNDLPASGNTVYVGQRLDLPGKRRAARKADVRRPARARHRPISPDKRRIVRYTVRPGDTPSELAVRFHAWTAELIAMNGRVLRVGERIRIPVVVAAVAADRRAKSDRDGRKGQADRPKKATKAKKAKKAKNGQKRKATKKAKKRKAAAKKRNAAEKRREKARQRRHRHATPSRATVRRAIARSARRHGVDPQLALAISWQESGWQMDRTSSAGAVGAMQVMPGTGRWMSALVGRRLHLRRLADNVEAGVHLLKILRQEARLRVAIAGYYQGLAGVRRHGMYSDTLRYVANVMALRRSFERGDYPA